MVVPKTSTFLLIALWSLSSVVAAESTGGPCAHAFPSRLALLKGAQPTEGTVCCQEKGKLAGEKVRPVKVTQENFVKEVKEAETVVLLDFWAEWCLPCLELEPILDKLAIEFAGRVKICKINVDENPRLVAEYVPDNIFPCLILMKDGIRIERRHGTDPEMKPEIFLRNWFKEHLEKEKTQPEIRNSKQIQNSKS